MIAEMDILRIEGREEIHSFMTACASEQVPAWTVRMALIQRDREWADKLKVAVGKKKEEITSLKIRIAEYEKIRGNILHIGLPKRHKDEKVENFVRKTKVHNGTLKKVIKLFP